MKTLDIQYRQAQSVNIDLGMLDIAILISWPANLFSMDFAGQFFRPIIFLEGKKRCGIE